MRDSLKCLTVLTVIIACILFAVLLGLSFVTINHDQMGIKYNKISRKVDTSTIYTEGRNYIHPADTMFIYSRRYVTVDFSKDADAVDCLSSDGIYISLLITFQYQIIQGQLFDILFEWGQMDSFDNYIRLLSRESIRQSCSNFTVNDFAQARGAVEQAMQYNLAADFVSSDAHATGSLLQLKNVEYPTDYQNALTATTQAKTDLQNAVNERPNQLTQANTTFAVANYTAFQQIVNAQATAQAILQQANADAQAINQTWVQRANAYKDVMTALNMNASEFINVYFKSYVLEQLNNPIISFN